MAEAKKKKYDLGKNGDVTFHVSEDAKRLLIEFDVDREGLTKGQFVAHPGAQRRQGTAAPNRREGLSVWLSALEGKR